MFAFAHAFACVRQTSSRYNVSKPSRRDFLVFASSMLAVAFSTNASECLAAQQQRKRRNILGPWPASYPFQEVDMERFDESADSIFYGEPKLVYHIDQKAVGALRQYYKETIRDHFAGRQSPPRVLDLCTSWISYLPPEYNGDPGFTRVAGLGMNAEELRQNPQLTEHVVHDLNKDPTLPYADDSFDLALCALSVDYLTHPLEVFRELQRVLVPGGLCLIAFSNRVFATKAVAHWTAADDLDHCYAVGCFFHFAGGFEEPVGALLEQHRYILWKTPQANGSSDGLKLANSPHSRASTADFVPPATRRGDPLFIVSATRKQR